MTLPVSAQRDPGRLGAGASDARFRTASYCHENQLFDQSIAEYKRVAALSAGTEFEATGRLLAASVGYQGSIRQNRPELKAQAEQDLTDLATAFPNTRYALVAKWLQFEAIAEPAARMQAADTLLHDYGAPTFAAVLGGASFQESTLPLQYRADIADIYYREAASLPEAERAKLMLFLRASFPSSGSRLAPLEFFKRRLRTPAQTHDGLPPNMPLLADSAPPVLVSNVPEIGAITDSRPAIEAVLGDGPFWNAQTSTSRTALFIDGIDVTGRVIWSTSIDTTGTQSHFERLKLSYKPEQPLTNGAHTATCQCIDNAGNKAERSWSFQSEGGPAPGPLTLQVRVLNKHVKPAKGEAVRLEVICAPGANVTVTVSRQKDEIYRRSFLSTSSPTLWTWDGVTQDGRQAPNGNYVVSISAALGGSSATESVNAEVNRQGGAWVWDRLTTALRWLRTLPLTAGSGASRRA